MAVLSAASSLLPFSYGAKRLSGKASSLVSRTSVFNLSSHWKSTRNFPRLYVSRAIANNGGYTDIFENETSHKTYTWPNDKRPRVCILGGGFGGLYTALNGYHNGFQVTRHVIFLVERFSFLT